MAFTLHKTTADLAKLTTIAFQQVRFRNRPNLQRPLPMHYNRKRFIAVCEPVMRPTPPICGAMLTPTQSLKSIVDENPYALYLAGKLRRDFAKHPMIAIFHYDSYTGYEFQTIRLMLHTNDFPMEIQQKINYKVVNASFQGTKWASVLPLCQSRTAFGFCQTKDVAKLVKVLKKMPNFVLIGLVYENRLLHRDDVDRVAKLSNMINQYSQLSTTLNLPTMNLCQNLLMGQVSLTNSLSTYSKQGGQAENSDSSSSSSSSDSEENGSSSSSDSDSDTEKQKS